MGIVLADYAPYFIRGIARGGDMAEHVFETMIEMKKIDVAKIVELIT